MIRSSLRRLLLLTAIAAGSVSTVSAAKPAKLLPDWSEADQAALKKGDYVPGWSLLGDDLPGEVAETDHAVPQPEAGEIADVTREAAAADVPENFLEAYFAERPKTFIIDPQGLLGEKEGRDREAFLKYHAEDSEVDLYVYLFDGLQSIPSSVREEETVERFFTEGRPAVVVYYYLGAPQKSDIYVSPMLSEAVSAAEQRRALTSSVEEALEKSDRFSQFEAFCVQLSIRIYWMERAAGLVVESEPAPLPRRVRANEETVIEPEAPVVVAVRHWADRNGAGAAVMAGALAIVALAIWIVRRRAQHRFPVFDVAPRLGGAYAGGIGAVISFGSTAQSPSSQRNDVPDYLGL